MSIIGLDIGTTGSKCTILDIEGKICSYAYKEYGIINPGPGLFELNPLEVWEAVKQVIANSVSRYKGDKITALCISSFGEAAVPVDRQGRVLHNSLLYTDVRGVAECEVLKNRLGMEKISDSTGLTAHPMYTINKIMWFREHESKIYTNTWKFMLFGDFILYMLGGVAAIDYSLASRTMAFNVTKRVWEQSIFDASGVRDDIFSEAVPSGTVIGAIDKRVAEGLGLPGDVQLVTGGHDQTCAAIGAGVLKEGMAVDGIGTVECITPAFEKPVINSIMMENNFARVPHAKDGMYITYAFNFTGGSLLKWYRDNFSLEEKHEAERTGENVYSILDRKAGNIPTDILVLPHFAGAGTPYMDTSAKGAIVGLSFETDSSRIYRALLEGVTYEMRYNVECLQNAGVKIEELRAVGGGAKSDLWLQIKADIMDKKVVTLDVDEAGTMGTAIIAAKATGLFKSYEDGADKLIKVKRIFYPEKKNRDIYSNNYFKYRKVYNLVKEICS